MGEYSFTVSEPCVQQCEGKTCGSDGCGLSCGSCTDGDLCETEREDSAARNDLVRIAGKDQAPCLVVDGKPIQDSDEIVRYLVGSATDLG